MTDPDNALHVRYGPDTAWVVEGERAYVRAPRGSEIAKGMEDFAEAAWDEEEQAWWVPWDRVHLALIVLDQAINNLYAAEDEAKEKEE